MNTHATKSPIIVRRPVAMYVARPGVHQHSAARRLNARAKHRTLSAMRLILLVLGLVLVGFYGCSIADQYLYQSYQNWAFERQIAGEGPATVIEYVRECTPFGFLLGSADRDARVSHVATKAAFNVNKSRQAPVIGTVLGRVNIPLLGLSAVVREGTDSETLKLSVGHVPSTALPGGAGNFAIAAHRDTLFRGLKNIRPNDEVMVETTASHFVYRVFATKIVKPSDVSVLRRDGGLTNAEGVAMNTGRMPARLLTMITCYPFNFVGSAPKRFIVQAQLIRQELTNNAGPKGDL